MSTTQVVHVFLKIIINTFVITSMVIGHNFSKLKEYFFNYINKSLYKLDTLQIKIENN